MQEPNIKNGCGGLRDYQNLGWMAYFRYRTRGPTELAGKGLLTASDARQLEAAYDFLLRVRNELHHVARRSTDALTKSVQPTVATNLGFADRSPSRRIERFMGEYYRHSRNVYLQAWNNGAMNGWEESEVWFNQSYLSSASYRFWRTDSIWSLVGEPGMTPGVRAMATVAARTMPSL